MFNGTIKALIKDKASQVNGISGTLGSITATLEPSLMPIFNIPVANLSTLSKSS